MSNTLKLYPDEYFLVTPRKNPNSPFGYGRLDLRQIQQSLIHSGIRKDLVVTKTRKDCIELAQKHQIGIPQSILPSQGKTEKYKNIRSDEDGNPLWMKMTCGEDNCIQKMREESQEYPELMYGYVSDDNSEFNGQDGDLYYVFFECQKKDCHTIGFKQEMSVCPDCGERICCEKHLADFDTNYEGFCTDCFAEDSE